MQLPPNHAQRPASEVVKRGFSHEAPPRPVAPDDATESKKVLKGVSILVVEDDVSSARLAGIVLNEAGAEVRFARTAEEALIALESFRPALIVLDMVLPKMSGLVLVQQLKADSASRSIVVVAVTSMNGPEAARMGIEAGCAAYIHKPIDIDSFAATLAQYLGAHS